jgi:hypothetical protein
VPHLRDGLIVAKVGLGRSPTAFDRLRLGCVQCVAEMPKVQKLYDHYKDGPSVKFLIVTHIGAADWSDRSVISFIDRLKRQ